MNRVIAAIAMIVPTVMAISCLSDFNETALPPETGPPVPSEQQISLLRSNTTILTDPELADLLAYKPQTIETIDPILTDGLGHVWRWGAWRDPITDAAYVEPTPTIPIAPQYSEASVSAASFSFSAGSCPEMISAALGVAGCMISYCESHWNPDATGAAGERGWFQIHPQHFDSTYDPAGNIAAAIRISGGGASWAAWSVRGVLSSGYCPSGERYPY